MSNGTEPWDFTPEMWESSVEEPTRPRTTGLADDRPFISPPRKLVEEKGPRIQTSPFPPMGECKEEKTLAPLQGTRPPLTALEQELRRLINRFSMENHSNTPDNILAEYLCSCLDAFDRATEQRERWYGRRTF